MSHPTRFCPEKVAPSAWIAPGAVLVGDVTLGEESSVWFQAVLRGDGERIEIGPRSNVQDGCVLHADPGFPCVIGAGVTLGHGAIVHGAVLEDQVLVGMNAVVMNGARIGRGSVVGVGAVVTEGTQVPPRSLVLGLPGRIKRELSDDDLASNDHAWRHYVELARQYRALAATKDARLAERTPPPGRSRFRSSRSHSLRPARSRSRARNRG